jgi:hypothetical protein
MASGLMTSGKVPGRRGAMRYTAIILLLTLAAPAGAELWQWTDDQGTACFSEDLGAVPRKFRKKATRMGDTDAEPAPAPPENPQEKRVGKKAPPAAPAVAEGKDEPGKTAPSSETESRERPKKQASYGGKAAEAWQAEFAAVNHEVNEAKRLLADKRNKLFGDASGISREEYFTCQKDLADLEKKYAEVYARKQALMKAADVAGVPDDLRW